MIITSKTRPELVSDALQIPLFMTSGVAHMFETLYPDTDLCYISHAQRAELICFALTHYQKMEDL